ncbi:MAG: hypothetical protein L6R39_007474, partial [Caloplaca ligustica]
MTNHRKPRTWAEEIAELDDPAPRDLDPEEPNDENSSVGGSEDDTAQAREHYVDVGKSRLRKPGGLELGPAYSGSNVSRSNLPEPAVLSDDDPFASAQSRQAGSQDSDSSGVYINPEDVDLNVDKEIDEDDEIDSDGAFGDGDGDRFHDFVFRGSKSTQATSAAHDQASGRMKSEEVVEDGDSADFSELESEEADASNPSRDTTSHHDDPFGRPTVFNGGVHDSEDIEMEDERSVSSDDEESESNPSTSNSEDDAPSPPADDDRAALRKMMAESQKVITSNLSKAAKSDIAKGRAIKRQRTTFDSLLNTRIRLQKALVAANSLHPSSPSSTNTPDPAIQQAEQAALNLWSTLDSLRQSLHPVSSSSTPPSPPLQPTPTTPLSTLWSHMQSHETRSHPHRTSTLNKWSAKTAPPSSLLRTSKFSATTPTQQPLSAVLEQQLESSTTMEKLVAKSRIPRSCVPVQATAAAALPSSSSSAQPEEEQLIYDDTPFYSLLLRDLLAS